MCSFIVTLVFLFALKSTNVVHGDENYGPYQILFSRAATCHGPKTKDLTVARCGTKQNNTIFSANITLPEVAKIETMKLTLYGVKAGSKKELYAYRAISPCKHFLLGPMLKHALNTTDTDSCTIKPGTYTMDFDATAHFRRIYGSVIYGDYISKIIAYNMKGNLACFICEVQIVPAKVNN
ncbi:hypothetical protein NE865_08414 [Phthorimaea operculella]|nr:hypothetical protein NE865_08414 [Phthorimaea operculella]